MRLATEISTRVVDTPPRRATPLSEVFIDRLGTCRLVAGARLRAAVAVGDDYLLLLTHGLQYDETLSIHLVDRAANLLDTAAIGGWCCTGAFADLALRPPDTASFAFLGDVEWRVEVFPQPRVVVPLLAEATGVSRPFGFRRRFRVATKPRR